LSSLGGGDALCDVICLWASVSSLGIDGAVAALALSPRRRRRPDAIDACVKRDADTHLGRHFRGQVVQVALDRPLALLRSQRPLRRHVLRS
jgi:hypothetical protein